MQSSPQVEQMISPSRGAYPAFNRGDIDVAEQPVLRLSGANRRSFREEGRTTGARGAKQYPVAVANGLGGNDQRNGAIYSCGQSDRGVSLAIDERILPPALGLL